MSDAAFTLALLALIVLFAGTPDLHDAIVAHLMPPACSAPVHHTVSE